MKMEISIVMIVYNSEDYINESIQSVLNQTFDSFEFIIVDDGSTDNTVQLIKQYNDPRITLHIKPHNYIASLNFGINISKGKYIVRMDADDQMLPHRLFVQYQYMEANPDITICGSWIKTFGCFEREFHYAENHKNLTGIMLMGNPLCHSSVIIRKDSINFFFKKKKKQVYNALYLYAEDYKLWCEIVKCGGKISNIQETLLLYRCSNNQLSSRRKTDMIKMSLRVRTEYLNDTIHYIANRYPQYIKTLNQLILNYKERNINFNELTLSVKEIYDKI